MNWLVERPDPSDSVRGGHRRDHARLGTHFLILLVATMILAGCISTRNSESPNRLMAEVKADHSHCVFSIADRSFEVGKDFDQIASFFKTLNMHNLEVHIALNTDTPFACVGGVVSTLETAGVMRFGFISEPPTTGEK